MRDTMQSALQRPDLSVWERTLLPTTSSRIERFLSGKYGEISSVSRLSEDGATGYRVTRLPGGEIALIDVSSLHPEVSWNSYHDTQTSSQPMPCPSYTLASTDQRAKLALVSEVTPVESIFDEWRRTLLTSVTTLVRMAFGSSLQTILSSASTIRRTTN